MGQPTRLRLIVTAIVGDMEPDTIEFETVVSDPDEGIAWIDKQLRDLADASST